VKVSAKRLVVVCLSASSCSVSKIKVMLMRLILHEFVRIFKITVSDAYFTVRNMKPLRKTFILFLVVVLKM
jgi:hypothetical protein